MSKPSCHTCPFSGTYGGHGADLFCHNAGSPEYGEKLSKHWWCSLHPDAPQPVYEAIVIDSPGGRPPGGGWEPIAYHPEIDEAMILWRRVVDYIRIEREVEQ